MPRKKLNAKAKSSPTLSTAAQRKNRDQEDKYLLKHYILKSKQGLRRIIARPDVPWRPVEWHITRSVECLSHHTQQTEDNLIACLVQCQIRSILFLRLREIHLEPAIIDYQVVSSRKRCR